MTKNMPQWDRHKNRIVNIEFQPVEELTSLPYPQRYTLIFITSGRVGGTVNDRPISVAAPGILCLAEGDAVNISEREQLAAQSFSFHADFLNSTYLSDSLEAYTAIPRIQTGLSLFGGNSRCSGVPRVTAAAFPLLLEWFFVLGTEVSAQSDERWACRIKKYFIKLLGLLEDLNSAQEHSPVDLVLEYIHTHYTDKISLADLTKCALLNRVSLNKMFQERCRTTAMGYLLAHRLKVAGELLTHTDMNLNDIARSTGFEYDTYFIKQFTAKKGMSPTAYRKTTRKAATAI
ncbi:AraC family transcriptional regulator [Paenibacillus sp. MMS20-IR301]|uniref:AraC family transcriptional regulator n=1 Tax=Paenibacillus sp. MMS20-IR301 TaxID=2895946 RepID=UPI0028E75CE0|nr:AraC family transcriptional regulator [Paenibacillus sp. MMS20-IR301]WNS45262.1 AraC family transcriptional regulator [Paenibacillus sp. MMS20-IR301]